MPPVYRIAEVCIYSLLNFLPFLALALYPFRHCMRFSKAVTGLFIGLLSIIQMLLGFWAAFVPDSRAGIISAVSTALYFLFYFAAVKKHFGKTLFTLLMLSNLANLAVISAKCLEGQFFPDLALQSYRWSFSLMLFAVEIIIAVPLFTYMRAVYTPAVEKEPSGFEWRYLWLIPATFYLMWYYCLYGSNSLSGLEIALRPGNTAFLICVNIGAALVYYVVTRLILEQNRITELQSKNYRLSMQTVQYENLREKIADAARARHDIRHHAATMQEYLTSQNYSALRDYLNKYCKELSSGAPMQYCANGAVNAIITYFAEQAADCNVQFTVKADIPDGIGIEVTDLSVLFGNLLENAVEACKCDNGDKQKKIVLRAKTDNNSLCITVDNTFSGLLRHTNSGMLISAKHAGSGIGTESVKSIAEKYGGVCKFDARGGMFYASAMLILPS